MVYIDKGTYQQEVRNAFLKNGGGRVKHFLVNPTPKNVKDATVEIAGLELSPSDEQILKKGLGLKDSKPLAEQINKKDSDDFKTLSNFLKGKTTDTDHKNLDVIAVLIDFNPRPFSKFKTVGKEDAPKTTFKEAKAIPTTENMSETFSVEEIRAKEILNEETPNNFKIHPFLKWGFSTILVLALLFGIYHFTSKEKKSCMAWMGDKYETVPCNTEFLDQKGIIVQVNNGDVNIENFRQLTPNAQTAFYDDAGNPQVWYASNEAGNPEFFNQNGNHPITHAPLKPVPLQLVARYKYVDENNVGSKTDGSNAEEKTISEKNDFLNAEVKNTEADEVAILAFSSEEIDGGLTQVLLQKKSEEKKKAVPLFYPERFSSAQKAAFAMGDFSEIPNLDNYVDAVLVATASYDFRKSNLNEKLIVCDAEMSYFLYDTKTKTKGFSKNATATGSGFSNTEAKRNALKKLVL